MPNKITTKTKKEIYYKCNHCGDEIFWNTHKKFTYCKCKKIWVDACLPVGRVARPSVALAKAGEDYACPVVSFAVLLGSGLVAKKMTVR